MTTLKRMIEVDDSTASALETRAAEVGVSVSELLSQMVGRQGLRPAPEELTELDRQWAAVRAGDRTFSHEEVVRWLDTWGTPDFRLWNDR